MKLIFNFLCLSLLPVLLSAQALPVGEIIPDAPAGLTNQTLMIPRFDLLDPEDGDFTNRRELLIRINQAAKESNTILLKVVSKAYDPAFKLVSLRDVDSLHRKEGYRYFLDMVLMPKQMTEPEPKAMVPAFVRYRTGNKMYNNRDLQFHYYFYVRDLETDAAYITSEFGGDDDPYTGIRNTLKQLQRDLAE